MAQPARNRREPSDLAEAEVEEAIEQITARDVQAGRDARGIYDTLTWGEGPGQIRQAVVQDWLWYRLPTKYLTDEVGYMTRLAGVAADLFTELGLDAYGAACHSDATAGVHAAFERSNSDGFKAMRKAMEASGIEPPDLADFSWGQVMGMEEATARSAVEDVLERAIAGGDLVVGGRGWRNRQREVAARALDAHHPSQPGQTWRTAVVTERIGTWVDSGSMRSETLGRLRSRVGNRLLHPIAAPPDVGDQLGPLTWLLDTFGDEQALTQAGYLNTAFVHHVHAHRPWKDPFESETPPRTETDEITLHRLRGFLESAGAVRKRGRALRRTTRGAVMATDPVASWTALVGGLGSRPWDRFVVETAGLILVDAGEEMSAKEVTAFVVGVAGEMGWRLSAGGGPLAPSGNDVSWAFSDARALLELFAMLEEHGDWRDRRWNLTAAGEATVLAIARASAAGPKERPW